MDKFIEAAAGKLPNAIARLGPAALASWSSVLLAWAWQYPDMKTLRADLARLVALPAVEQLALGAGAALSVSVSIIVVERITQMLVPWLANPWPRPLALLHTLGVRRQTAKAEPLRQEWDALSRQVFCGTPPDDELSRFNIVDARLRDFPPADRTGPTRTANLLRATWLRPQQRTGVSTNLILPRLFLVLPESVHADLTTQWTAVTTALSYTVWSVLVLPAWYWCPYVPLLTLAGLSIAWFEVPRRSERYGGTLEAAMDLYRFDVLDRLHWPLPKSTSDEHEHGSNLSAYLLRGEARTSVDFRHPQS